MQWVAHAFKQAGRLIILWNQIYSDNQCNQKYLNICEPKKQYNSDKRLKIISKLLQAEHLGCIHT